MKQNDVTMRGRLGHEPVLRKTSGGKSVVNVSIAVYAGKDADGNAKTNWFNWVIWEKKADEFCFSAHKGDTIRFEGKASNAQGKTKGGETYPQVMFVADDYEITPKKAKTEAPEYQYGAPYTPVEEEVPF